MELEMLLITGRTLKQGLGLVRGKNSSDYRDEVVKVDVSRPDLEALGASEGNKIYLESDFGSMTGIARVNEGLPKGMVFVPQGPFANRLIGGGTQGTGMPDYKGIKVRARLA